MCKISITPYLSIYTVNGKLGNLMTNSKFIVMNNGNKKFIKFISAVYKWKIYKWCLFR